MNEKELIKNEEKIDYNIDRKEVYVEPSQPVMDLLCNDIEEKIYIRSGECILTIGLEGKSKERGITASQMQLSLETLEKICTILKCKSTLILAEKLEDGNEIQHFLIRKNMINSIYIEVRIAILGNVDAGKTSFLGVLTLDQLDDGRGLTRGRLHQHLHEKTSGRTSSVSNYILGFNEDCDYVKPIKGKVDWKNVRINSSKIITFIDLAGHEKYFKTTVFGMTSNKPHHSVLVIGANAGIIGMTKEHLSLILALDLPLIIVVTKIDMCPQNILAETMSLIQKILKSPGCRKITVSIKSIKDVVVCIKEITNKRICPVFQVSNVTGEGINLFKMFLNLLPNTVQFDNDKELEISIDRTFKVAGVGTVVSGIVMNGTIKVNDTINLGPDYAGKFHLVQVKSLHSKRLKVEEISSGYSAGIALKKVKRDDIRRGMILCSKKMTIQCCYDFVASLVILHHPSTISIGYQGMLNVDNIRQSVQLIEMDKPLLRTGDKATVIFRFIMFPEALKEGSRIIFREGKTKAFGKIKKIIPYIHGEPVPVCLSKAKLAKIRREKTTV